MAKLFGRRKAWLGFKESVDLTQCTVCRCVIGIDLQDVNRRVEIADIRIVDIDIPAGRLWVGSKLSQPLLPLGQYASFHSGFKCGVAGDGLSGGLRPLDYVRVAGNNVALGIGFPPGIREFEGDRDHFVISCLELAGNGITICRDLARICFSSVKLRQRARLFDIAQARVGGRRRIITLRY